MIKTGDIDVTPLRLFQRKIIEPLRAFLDSSPGSIAVIIPSIRDIVSFHNVYPQAEFGSDVSTDHVAITFPYLKVFLLKRFRSVYIFFQIPHNSP